MKAHLMYRQQDFALLPKVPEELTDLVQDLEVETLVEAMADGDELLDKAARSGLLGALKTDRDTIVYRQGILRDCLEHGDAVRQLFKLAAEPAERSRRIFSPFSGRSPGPTLSSAVNVLEMLRELLGKLAEMARTQGSRFASDGFKTFFAMIERELDEAYLQSVDAYLQQLHLRQGILLGAGLDQHLKGRGYALLKLESDRWAWLKDILQKGPPGYSFHVHPRDEAGFTALTEIRDRGLARAANVVAQSVDHILNFFSMLRVELAFYIGCINLHQKLTDGGQPLCFPEPADAGTVRLHFEHLRDAGLALTMKDKVVPNDLQADDKPLLVITGANQGGKSTFLRSVGTAQLMMQAGMFVAAESFSASICDGIYTHYRRQEDSGLRSGKFDEELRRMDGIVGRLGRHPLLLFNESFAATNEREGSEIAKQIVTALLDHDARVVFVTHMYALAQMLEKARGADTTFLKPERTADGKRSFRILPGEASQTSFGKDIYRRVFGDDDTDEPRRKKTAEAG